MNAVSQFSAMIESGERPPGPGASRLKPGDRVMAKVLDVGKDGLVRLDLGRFTVMARLPAPVIAGMHLPLEVMESAGQILFRVREPKRRAEALRVADPSGESVDPDTAEAAGRQLLHCLRQLKGIGRWAALPSARQGVPGLLRLLTPIDLQSSSPEAVARRIQESVEDSGLFLESRLARNLQAAVPPGADAPALSAGRNRPSPSMIARGDAKAVILQMLADLGHAAEPLPPGLALLKKSAAALLADIRRRQHPAVEHGHHRRTGQRHPLIYGPRSEAGAAMGKTAKPGAHPEDQTLVRWRVTGQRPLSGMGYPESLTEAAHHRRRLLTTAETVALGLNRPCLAHRWPGDENHLSRTIQAYLNRSTRHAHTPVPAGWRRLARLAEALSRKADPAKTSPGRRQRLSEAVLRMIREEIDRFDADLHLLQRMTRGQSGEEPVPSHHRRAGSASGESGQLLGFTIPMAGPEPPVRLNIHYPARKPRGSPDGHQVAILLCLRPMGDVRAELSLTPQGLRVNLRLAEDSARRLVFDHREILESALKQLAPAVWIETLGRNQEPSTTSEPRQGRCCAGSKGVNVDA